MNGRIVILTIAALFLFSLGFSRPEPTRDGVYAQLPPAYVPPGHQMYRDYCAACHGIHGRGDGPMSASLVKRPPDLTTLAKRNSGTFPGQYVSNVLRFGPGFSAHGSSEMPVWGPIFQYLDNYNEAAVRQRIKNLCDYLESIQVSERN